MKSKTSFFNTSLLRKDILRFAPAWALYAAFLLLIFGGGVLGSTPKSIANNLSDSISFFAFANLGYGLLCAQLLFGDLHNSRMCNALHALPLRRESWFATHLAAGMLFSLLPVAAAGLLFLLFLKSFWLAALLWMAALILQFFLFFAIGALSMLLTGNRFAAVTVYCILNFLAGIVLWLYYALYLPHLHGLTLDYEPWLVLCPVVEMGLQDWFSVGSAPDALYLKNGWGYLGICAAVAVVILALSLWLYRKRNLESAGDFLAFRGLEPAFMVLFTFSAGAALHLFSQLFVGSDTDMLFLVVGLTIGFFTGLMLLRRTLRVFRMRTFATFGILLAAFGLSLLLTVLDPLGITRWVPKADEVRWVTIDRMYSSIEADYRITDEALIEQVIAIHQHGVEHPEADTNGKQDISVTLHYTLTSGRTVAREYTVDTDTLAAMTLKYVLSQPVNLFGSNYPTPEALLEEVYSIQFYAPYGKYDETLYTKSDREAVLAILKAVYADAEAGNLCQAWPLYSGNGQSHTIYIECRSHLQNGYYTHDSWYINYNPSAQNTTALIQSLIP